MNVLTDRVFTCELEAGPRRMSLPELLAAAARDEINSFSRVRPHHRHPFHAFLVQLGAFALDQAGRDEMPDDPRTWETILRGLTNSYPNDEPWTLAVADPSRPAFLQPSTNVSFEKSAISPEGIDTLVVSRHHDLKQTTMIDADEEAWIYALIAIQTHEGYLGKGNYGISRMNGGYANRCGIGLSVPGGPGARIRRDIERLMVIKDDLPMREIYAAKGGLGLTWLEPWDGKKSISQKSLHPFFIEICRIIRIEKTYRGFVARRANSAVSRIAAPKEQKGMTGDPWAPYLPDGKDTMKVLTVNGLGFPYWRMSDIIAGGKGIKPAPLQEIAPTDPDQGLSIVARALVRGEGGTEGYHERVVPLSKKARVFLSPAYKDRLAGTAAERVSIAGTLVKILSDSLIVLYQNGPEKIDFDDDGAVKKAKAHAARLEVEIDREFFPALWDELEHEAGPEASAARIAWIRSMLKTAEQLLEEATPPSVHLKYKALAAAKSMFRGRVRKNFPDAFPKEAMNDTAA